MWLDLTTTHRQTWLFSYTYTYHSTDLLTARGVAHLVVHGTSGSTSYETIPSVRLETSVGVLSTVDMVVQRRDGRRRQRDDDDDDDDLTLGRPAVAGCGLLLQMFSVLSVGRLHCCEFRRKNFEIHVIQSERHLVFSV